MHINLEHAQKAIEAARNKAVSLKTQECIAVVDSGANLKAFLRMDDAWVGSIDIAIKKAKTACFFAMPTAYACRIRGATLRKFKLHHYQQSRHQIRRLLPPGPRLRQLIKAAHPRQWKRIRRTSAGGMGHAAWRAAMFHPPRATGREWVHRKFQRSSARRVSERRMVRLVARSTHHAGALA